MSDRTPTAYPLSWPSGWPKTPGDKREPGKFQSTLPGALAALQEEVRRLGGLGLVLSSNCTLGESRPADPGVVAYFTYEKAQVAIPCDRWQRVEHNVRAIALTIEAMRGMERWGARHMIKAMFSGFKALPAPADSEPWYEVLECGEGATFDVAQSKYRALVKAAHPDAPGGSHVRMVKINAAWAAAKEACGWK